MKNEVDFDYKKYLDLITRKKYLFVITAFSIMTAAIIVSYLIPPRYQASCTVFIEKSVISELVRGIAVTPSMEDRIRVLAYAMKSRTLFLKVLDDLDLNVSKMSDAQQESMIKDFQARTDIKLKDREGLFIISFHNENPQLARDFVNTLARQYIEENVSSKREDSYGATTFLSDQIATVKAKLDEAEDKINSFRRENQSAVVEREDIILREIEEAQQKIEETALRRNQLEAVRDSLHKADPLQARLSGLHKRLNELTLTYTDKYPEVIEVRNEIDTIKAQMRNPRAAADSHSTGSQELERVNMELRTLQGVEANQRRLISSKRALLKSIPATMASLEELEREKRTQKNLYEQLMARHGQSEVSKQMEVQDKSSTFRIVDPAVLPAKPISPNRVRIILLGIAAGLAGAFGLLALLDYLDDSVRSITRLKSLGLPVLAVVPRIEDPAAVAAARKRELLFYCGAGAYLLLIVGTLSLETMRTLSAELMTPSEIRQAIFHWGGTAKQMAGMAISEGRGAR